MRSHLTRNVFRTLLASEPIIAKGCLRQSRSWRSCQNGLRSHTGIQRRHLFGLTGTGLDPRRPDFAKAKGKTLLTSKIVGNLIAAQKQQLRPPPRKDVAAVLRTFFRSLSKSTPLTEYDINFTTVALKYVQGDDGEVTKPRNLEFAEADLRNLLLALTAGAVKSTKNTAEAKELGDLVLKDLTSENPLEEALLDEIAVMRSDYAGTYIELLTATGHGNEALRLVKHFGGQVLWLALLQSTAQKRHEKELSESIDAYFENGKPEEQEALRILRRVASLNLVEATKSLYALSERVGFTFDNETKMALVQFSIRNKETTFGQPILASLEEEMGDETSRLQYLWSAAKGVPSEEIVAALEEYLAREGSVAPDHRTLATINGLVQYANSMRDPAAAEQYLSLIPKWGFQPNAATYLAQFEHYLATRNIELAVQACEELHQHPMIQENFDNALQALENEDAATHQDVKLLNRLIVAVSTMDRPNYDLAMNVLDTLLERTTHLQSDTVAALIGMFLVRGEYQEIHDLLESHYPVFSREERDECRAVVLNFITDMNVDALQAWHAYDMFRNVFADTSITVRGEIMKSFFERKKSDLACLVFGHMRQVQDPKARPTAELYTECFKGIAECNDPRGVELVHNMLKLDVFVDPNTRILTSLMMAWANAGEAWRSLQIFDDILNTVEGPSFTTLAVAFRSCEKFTPNGRPFAMQFMSRIKAGGHEITKEVYLAYLGAIAGNGDYNNAVELVENMESETGYPPDAIT